jgi:hypothetical protein
MKKTWGFGIPSGPLQFSTQGARDTAKSLLNPGELVTIVGTQGEPTPEHQQGKILGLMEPTKIDVSSLDYSFQRRPEDFDEQGSFRWPFGLELRAAWRFLEPLSYLSDVSQRNFGREGALGLVALAPADEETILALPREKVELLQPLRTRVQISGEDIARKRAAPRQRQREPALCICADGPPTLMLWPSTMQLLPHSRSGGLSTIKCANGSSTPLRCRSLGGWTTKLSFFTSGIRRWTPFAWSNGCCVTSTASDIPRIAK